MQTGELFRLLGHVKAVNIVSMYSNWSMRHWTVWREIGRLSENMRVEFSWVNPNEVMKRPVGGYTRTWRECGENSQMARAGSHSLSLDDADALVQLAEVGQRLEDEKVKYPTGWTMPKVQLDFVRYD